MGTKSPIEQLKSEAEANFKANRWEDSAKTYEHLVRLAQDEGDLPLAIDFAIAAIRSWSKMPDKKARITRLYQAIGFLGLKQAAIGFESIARKAEEAKNLKEAATNYENAADGYNYLSNFDRAKKCFENSVSILEELGKKAYGSKDLESAIHLYDRIIIIYQKLVKILDRIFLEQKEIEEETRKKLKKEKKKMKEAEKSNKKKKAKAHEKLAASFLKKEDSDYYRVAEKEFLRAMELFQELDDSSSVKRVKEKIKKAKDLFSIK
ncbi:MAG: hypothetical protein GF308_20850 [Candidatus Heimdallarchaeota archaeon]|nr:hypothetical protein [Candidatus Heimdallarchaeota archaeon]